MAKKQKKQKKNGGCGTGFWILIAIGLIVFAGQETSEATGQTRGILGLIGFIIIAFLITKKIVEIRTTKKRERLYSTISAELDLDQMAQKLKEYDDYVTVGSQKGLENYTDIKYLKEHENFEKVKVVVEAKDQISERLNSFITENKYGKDSQYIYVKDQLMSYMALAEGYRVNVIYKTAAGNYKGSKTLCINSRRIKELNRHPEYLMTKGEYNQLLKQQNKENLDAKKKSLYERVNNILEYASESKETLVVKNKEKTIDELMQKLYDKTVNSIQKISSIDSNEWTMIENFINSIEDQLETIIHEDKIIDEYYHSEKFNRIKDTCSLLMQSQKDFNEYINEKAASITKLFGTRVVRNETQNEDSYNYIRAYKKTITPFTAEVSATVFSSAENNPIDYIIKYFYPNKSQYKIQIDRLRILIEELETLREAKDIIENYKKDYNQYIEDVPSYVMENDEEGFYSRLGLATINESVLNIEYKFVYTSNGGMAQRSFTVPMNEENITELIHKLENKLTNEALAKEQRALMTTKLRLKIKERDNYTCCQCGNSLAAEPNLLLEVDHIIPIARGGLTQEDNLQTLCWKCNRSKGSKIIN